MTLPFLGILLFLALSLQAAHTNRAPLPTADEIKRQIDFLARWKASPYYLYSEANSQPRGYPPMHLCARM